MRLSKKTFIFLALAAFVFCAVLPAPVPAEQQEEQIVESPRDLVARNLAETRKKLAQLKAQYTQCCGATALDIADEAEAIIASLPAPKTLKWSVSLPEPTIHLNLGLYTAEEGPWMGLYTELRIWAYPVGFYDFDWRWRGTVAADDLTGALLGLPTQLRFTTIGDVRCWAEGRKQSFGRDVHRYPVCCSRWETKREWRKASNLVGIIHRYQEYYGSIGNWRGEAWNAEFRAPVLTCLEWDDAPYIRRFPSMITSAFHNTYDHYLEGDSSVKFERMGVGGEPVSINSTRIANTTAKTVPARVASFSEPGLKTITARAPKWQHPESIVPANCTLPPRHYVGIQGDGHNSFYDRARKGIEISRGDDPWTFPKSYKAEGFVEAQIEINVVKYEDFGIPGLDIELEETRPVLDFFMPAARPRHGNLIITDVNSNPRFFPEPKMIIHSAAGRQVFPVYDYMNLLRGSLSVEALGGGPFAVQRYGARSYSYGGAPIGYSGGSGQTEFVWALSNHESVRHTLTANLVEVILDDRLLAWPNQRTAVGAPYSLRLLVKGPVPMNQYEIRHETSGLGVNEPSGREVLVEMPDGGFKPGKNGIWEARLLFTVVDDGSWRDIADNPGQRVQIDPFDITVSVMRPDDGSGRDFTAFSYRFRVQTGAPAADSIELYSALGPGELAPADKVDLFYPNEEPDTRILRTAPWLTLANQESRPIDALSTLIGNSTFEIVSSNPSAAFVSGRLPDGTVGITPGAQGRSIVKARLGGGNLDPMGRLVTTGEGELVSPPLEVNVNNLLLSHEPRGTRHIYRLTVLGPSSMSGYQAVIGSRTVSFAQSGGAWVAQADLSDTIVSVSIQKERRTVARISAASASPHAKISILPSTAPVGTVTRVTDLADAGSLQTLTDCRKQVQFWVDAFGFDAGGPVDAYCRGERERQKQLIADERAEQKARNELLRDLERQGRELVVFADTMPLGAVVQGLPQGISPQSLLCRWTLIDGGQMKLEHTQTVLQAVSSLEAACFNAVTNIQAGFSPNAKIRVDLVMESAPGQGIPTFASGSAMTISASHHHALSYDSATGGKP